MHPQPPRRTTHAYGTPKNLLVYDRWGGYGRPVVLLHGLFYDRTIWWPVAAELTGPCSVIAVDLPGHGQSAERGDNDLDALARDLAVLVRDLQLHRAPVLVGQGEGALLAEAFAAAYATRAVLTFDEPAFDEPAEAPPESPEPHEGDADLAGVPAAYRQFAVPRGDRRLRDAYRCWFSRGVPARAAKRPGFPHLRAPARFAATLRDLI
ncbi:alpha/beta fold hydrolase [Actinoplanes flavus]|uniref:Alpha/beta fold hydrolase n=1 Tax=Actinoplanes flavus TaxID=2820290 RepID=A0ABS3UY13_9ACTN|nr:alpha/beta fold hydrolase [Actinoplanes flavus]MBO3743452.1 alpha/beta fold hydrolase [Actinoplanes flavus]